MKQGCASAKGCDVVFCAPPTEVVKQIEPDFGSGFVVVIEAAAHRMEVDVSLMIPEINADHLKLLDAQKKKRGWKGGLATTPNCIVTCLAIVVKPLIDDFGAQKVIVTTMQTLSGAGYPGVPLWR